MSKLTSAQNIAIMNSYNAIVREGEFLVDKAEPPSPADVCKAVNSIGVNEGVARLEAIIAKLQKLAHDAEGGAIIKINLNTNKGSIENL